jgi:alkylhydroperoxidase/carboxymuconolactone decarboxylase family protein YurZ
MRLLIAALALVLLAMPAAAMSIKDFQAKPEKQRSAYVVDFIEKMTADIGTKNPKLMQDIRHYFYHETNGKVVAEGIDSLYAELAALYLLAKEGKVDLSKIQVEGVIVKIVKDKFPPPSRQ